MIKNNQLLDDAFVKERAKREIISDCETRFSSWIYRFVRSHQELLDNGEYRFLYYAARDALICSQFEELNKNNAIEFERVGACLDLATDCMQKDEALLADQYAPLVNWLALLLHKYKNSRFCH